MSGERNLHEIRDFLRDNFLAKKNNVIPESPGGLEVGVNFLAKKNKKILGG